MTRSWPTDEDKRREEMWVKSAEESERELRGGLVSSTRTREGIEPMDKFTCKTDFCRLQQQQ